MFVGEAPPLKSVGRQTTACLSTELGETFVVRYLLYVAVVYCLKVCFVILFLFSIGNTSILTSLLAWSITFSSCLLTPILVIAGAVYSLDDVNFDFSSDYMGEEVSFWNGF